MRISLVGEEDEGISAAQEEETGSKSKVEELPTKQHRRNPDRFAIVFCGI